MEQSAEDRRSSWQYKAADRRHRLFAERFRGADRLVVVADSLEGLVVGSRLVEGAVEAVGIVVERAPGWAPTRNGVHWQGKIGWGWSRSG